MNYFDASVLWIAFYLSSGNSFFYFDQENKFKTNSPDLSDIQYMYDSLIELNEDHKFNYLFTIINKNRQTVDDNYFKNTKLFRKDSNNTTNVSSNWLFKSMSFSEKDNDFTFELVDDPGTISLSQIGDKWWLVWEKEEKDDTKRI